MAPAPRLPSVSSSRAYSLSRVLFALLSTGIRCGTRLAQRLFGVDDLPAALVFDSRRISRRCVEPVDQHRGPKLIVFVALIPVLVLLSGLFAGLTLGYMSLDETQLNVLSASGTQEQRRYANKIKPIRKDGHRLLVTLLLANMIVNESLPVIADPVLGGGVQGVVVSTILIVLFSEIIPQSLFTRHGLYLGAKLAGLTKCLLYGLAIIAWPIAKLLEFVLGGHHGLIYRRAELKELIAMHSASATHGGDLKMDTVNIIGATLDLQEKVVQQVMTDIKDVYMLSIDAKLDCKLLKEICETGHSRIPVYEEVDVPLLSPSTNGPPREHTFRVKRIVGILLVKTCVLLDPKDAVPIRAMPLNRVSFVAGNEPLLAVLDKFQEGRSHMAIVSRLTLEKAHNISRILKRELSEPLRVPLAEEKPPAKLSRRRLSIGRWIRGNAPERLTPRIPIAEDKASDQDVSGSATSTSEFGKEIPPLLRKGSAALLEQVMPSDAALTIDCAHEFLQNFDPAVMPLGILTLEDVLEELIGEEIYDEFDTHTARHLPVDRFVQEDEHGGDTSATRLDTLQVTPDEHSSENISSRRPILKGMRFLRSKSAPPGFVRRTRISAPTATSQQDVVDVTECQYHDSSGIPSNAPLPFGGAKPSPIIGPDIPCLADSLTLRGTQSQHSHSHPGRGSDSPEVSVDPRTSIERIQRRTSFVTMPVLSEHSRSSSQASPGDDESPATSWSPGSTRGARPKGLPLNLADCEGSTPRSRSSGGQ